jgi:hypothetical protein
MAPHTRATASPTPEGPGPGPSHESHESHGRRLTTTPEAAARYRSAQARSGDRASLVAALRAAVRADPGFVVAAADLAALAPGAGDAVAARAATPLRAWERHHVEVVAAAAGRDARRAVDLLREHLAVVTCDPVATAVVVGAAAGEALDDILDRLPGCHGRPGQFPAPLP